MGLEVDFCWFCYERLLVDLGWLGVALGFLDLEGFFEAKKDLLCFRMTFGGVFHWFLQSF